MTIISELRKLCQQQETVQSVLKESYTADSRLHTAYKRSMNKPKRYFTEEHLQFLFYNNQIIIEFVWS